MMLLGPEAGIPAAGRRPPEGNYMTGRMPQLVDFRGVRTERYTYCRRRDGDKVAPWLLYDNREDPYQLKNLVGDAACRDIQAGLDKMTGAWLALVGETFG